MPFLVINGSTKRSNHIKYFASKPDHVNFGLQLSPNLFSAIVSHFKKRTSLDLQKECLNHLNHHSLNLSSIFVTFTSQQILSFPTLSIQYGYTSLFVWGSYGQLVVTQNIVSKGIDTIKFGMNTNIFIKQKKHFQFRLIW